MNTPPASLENEVTKCVIPDREERRAVAVLDTESRTQIQKYGSRDILTMNFDSKMDDVTTMKTYFTPPKSPGVRRQGIRGELLEKYLMQTIREKVRADLKPPTIETDYRSTTQIDFLAEGFVPAVPGTTNDGDYVTDQAVTFWSENHQRIQGVTGVRTSDPHFRKSSAFSTPVTLRLDEVDELPPKK